MQFLYQRIGGVCEDLSIVKVEFGYELACDVVNKVLGNQGHQSELGEWVIYQQSFLP